MILNNYWNYLNYISKNDPPTTATQITMGLVYNLSGYKYRDGSSGSYNAALYIDPPADDSYSSWVIRKNLGVRVGHGTTAPTADDYKIESDDTDSFTSFSATVSSACSDGKLTMSIAISGINNTNDNITISEFIIYKPVRTYYWNGSAYYIANIAFVREVLDTPIVVGPGESLSKVIRWEQA